MLNTSAAGSRMTWVGWLYHLTVRKGNALHTQRRAQILLVLDCGLGWIDARI